MTAAELMKLAHTAHRANRAMGHNPCGDTDERSDKAEVALQSAIESLVGERDRLKAAVMEYWKYEYSDMTKLSMIFCVYCFKVHPKIETPFEHSDNCIVKRYEGEK